MAKLKCSAFILDNMVYEMSTDIKDIVLVKGSVKPAFSNFTGRYMIDNFYTGGGFQRFVPLTFTTGGGFGALIMNNKIAFGNEVSIGYLVGEQPQYLMLGVQLDNPLFVDSIYQCKVVVDIPKLPDAEAVYFLKDLRFAIKGDGN